MNIFELVGKVTLDGADKVNDQFSKMEEKTKKVQKGLRIAGAAFTALGVAGLALVGKTKEINAQLGVTAINLGLTVKEMRDLTLATTNVTFPIEEVIASFDLLARAGVKDKKVLQETATAFDTLGDATGYSASRVTEIMVPAMKTFNLTASEMAGKTDLMTYMSRKSTMSLEDFATMVGYTTPQLVEQGLTLDDLTISLIHMEKQGYAPGRVMTREFMKATNAAEKQQISLTEALGISSDELAGYREELEGATGMTQTYADEANKQYTLMDKLKQRWSEITLSMSAFLEPLEPILAGMTALGPVMLLLSTSFGTTAIRIGLTTAALIMHKVTMLAHTIAVRAATAAQWAWNAAMTANPIGLLIVGLGALAGGITAIVSGMGDAAAKTEEYTDAALQAWLQTQELTDSMTQLEKVTAALSYAESELARVDEMLTTAGAARTAQSQSAWEAYTEEEEAVDKVIEATKGYVDATEGLTAANIAHATALEQKTKLTEHEIRWLKIYANAIEVTTAAERAQKEAVEAVVAAEEARQQKYESFISTIEKIVEEYEDAQTEAGKLNVTLDDLIEYMRFLGQEIDRSTLSLEDFERYGEDATLWAEHFGVSLEEVARISSKTFDDMLDDVRGLTDEAINSARERKRAEISAIQEQTDAYRAFHQEKMEAIQEEYTETLKTIDAQLAATIEGYQSQVDVIEDQLEEISDAEKARRDEERKGELEAAISEEEDADKRVALEDRLNDLIIQSKNRAWQDERALAYRKAVAESQDADERAQLERALAWLLVEVQAQRNQAQLEADRENLRDRMELAREQAQIARADAQDTYDHERALEEDALKRFISNKETEISVLERNLEKTISLYERDYQAFTDLLDDKLMEVRAFVDAYNDLMAQLAAPKLGPEPEPEPEEEETPYPGYPGPPPPGWWGVPGGKWMPPSPTSGLIEGLHSLSPQLTLGGTAGITSAPPVNIVIQEMIVREEADIERVAEKIVERIRLRTGVHL